MRREFVEDVEQKLLGYELEVVCPWAVRFVGCEGGWVAFEDVMEAAKFRAGEFLPNQPKGE